MSWKIKSCLSTPKLLALTFGLSKENQMNFEKIMDYVTAISIGVGLAVLLVAWWST